VDEQPPREAAARRVPPSAACQRCCWCRPGRASPIARAGATGGQARHRVILTARAISVPFRARRQWPPRSCTCRPSYDPTVGNATARRPSGSRWLSRERAVLPWQLLLCAEPAALTGTAMSILISSDQLPAGERFERWRETLRQSRMAPVEVQSDAEADLRFELRYRDLGAIRVVLATATRIGYGGPQADPPIGSRSALARNTPARARRPRPGRPAGRGPGWGLYRLQRRPSLPHRDRNRRRRRGRPVAGAALPAGVGPAAGAPVGAAHRRADGVRPGDRGADGAIPGGAGRWDRPLPARGGGPAGHGGAGGAGRPAGPRAGQRRLAGKITAAQDHWLLSNLSVDRTTWWRTPRAPTCGSRCSVGSRCNDEGGRRRLAPGRVGPCSAAVGGRPAAAGRAKATAPDGSAAAASGMASTA
jgi:hypothetical protein